MYTSNTQQASYPFWRAPCDACAADHVINSSRPSASVFPPPHLIITRNAHGAEEGEGLGTRLRLTTWRTRHGIYRITRYILIYALSLDTPLRSRCLITLRVDGRIINSRRPCTARVTVVVLCVSLCMSVCLSVCLRLFLFYRLRGGLLLYTNTFSATRAKKIMWRFC